MHLLKRIWQHPANRSTRVTAMIRLRSSILESRWIWALLMFANGFGACALIFLWVHGTYENVLYERLVSAEAGIVSPEMSNTEKALALLEAAHLLVKPRFQLLGAHGAQGEIGLRRRFFSSGDIALIEGSGACGSYTHVLAQLLRAVGIPRRIAQMQCGDEVSCHILIEAKIDGHWVVLDPSYNLSFRNDDGTLASFAEVSQQWSVFKRQVPPDYPAYFNYDGVRYTNWSKIPLVLPSIKNVLLAIMGDESQFISLRTYLLNIYMAYFVVLSFVQGGMICLTLWLVWKRRAIMCGIPF